MENGRRLFLTVTIVLSFVPSRVECEGLIKLPGFLNDSARGIQEALDLKNGTSPNDLLGFLNNPDFLDAFSFVLNIIKAPLQGLLGTITTVLENLKKLLSTSLTDILKNLLNNLSDLIVKNLLELVKSLIGAIIKVLTDLREKLLPTLQRGLEDVLRNVRNFVLFAVGDLLGGGVTGLIGLVENVVKLLNNL